MASSWALASSFPWPVCVYACVHVCVCVWKEGDGTYLLTGSCTATTTGLLLIPPPLALGRWGFAGWGLPLLALGCSGGPELSQAPLRPCQVIGEAGLSCQLLVVCAWTAK